MILLPSAGDQLAYWKSRTLMPGNCVRISSPPARLSSAGPAPAMPPSITMFPFPFSISASQSICIRPWAALLEVTKETKLSLLTLRSTQMTGIPCFIVRVVMGSRAAIVAALRSNRSIPLATRSSTSPICLSGLSLASVM